MSGDEGRGTVRGCFKYGCIGFLVVVGAPIVIGVLLVLLNLAVGSPDADQADRTYSREVASERILVQDAEGADHPAASLPTAEPGRVVLDLTEGLFEVVPGVPGEPIKVEASYDNANFELVEKMSTVGEIGWKYEVSFAPRRGWWLRLLSGSGDNRVKVSVPPDVPFRLEGTIGYGESRVELGNTATVSVDLDYGPGGHRMVFSEPLLVPAESIRMISGMGETFLSNLGNASPATAEVRTTMGELRVDLDGKWMNDSVVMVKSGLGEISVKSPEQARLELEGSDVIIGESTVRVPERDLPEDAPTVSLTVDHSIGGVNIR